MRIWSQLLTALLMTAVIGQAHDPGLSSATLWLGDEGVTAELTFAPQDVETIVPPGLDRGARRFEQEALDRHPVLETLLRDGFRIWLNGAHVVASEFSAPWVSDSGNPNAQFRLQFPFEGRVKSLRVDSGLLQDLPPGHRQYLSLLDEAGNLLGDAVLDARHSAYEQDVAGLAAEQRRGRFQHFFALGVEHIATGYDHLLFLFGLLIVGGSFVSAAKIITSFTLAHSLTLALATLGSVRVPSEIVEPVIALSIAYVGIENLFVRNLERRWVLTFAFGLVHGLGFASVLRDLSVAGSGAASAVLPLLAFNMGVETGQIAIAAAVLPLIWKLAQPPVLFPRFSQAGSLAVAVMGAFWLVERTLLG